MESIPSIWGSLVFETSLSLEELAAIVSESMCGGLPFGGREKNIYDEIPAIFIEGSILGWFVILSEEREYSYRLEIKSYFTSKEVKNEWVHLDGYLFEFFKNYLQSTNHDIGIVATKIYGEKRYPAVVI